MTFDMQHSLSAAVRAQFTWVLGQPVAHVSMETPQSFSFEKQTG